MKTMRWLDQNIEKCVLAFLLACIVTILSYAVLMRYAFRSPPFWANTLAQYCFVLSVFFSISYCIRRNTSLKVDIFSKYLPARAVRVLSFISLALCLAFFALFTYAAFFVVQHFVTSNTRDTALGIPMYAFYLFALAGFALSTVRCVQAIWFLFSPEKR